MDDLEHVGSLDQFVKVVSARSRKWQGMWKKQSAWLPWFRGEEDADWSTRLRPRLYRTKRKLNEVLGYEQELRLEFKRRGAQLAGEGKPADHWERYVLMQHYGVPTRLLDWSDGALVALYFALRSFKGSRDAAVYTLDPWWLNKLVYRGLPIPKRERLVGTAMTDWDEAQPYLPEDEFDNDLIGPKSPLAIDPSHVGRRLAAQRSRFTIFGRDVNGLVKICDKMSASERRLCRIPVKRAAVVTMRRDLARCGISESTIFPDLDGLGRELNAMFQALSAETNTK